MRLFRGLGGSLKAVSCYWWVKSPTHPHTRGRRLQFVTVCSGLVSWGSRHVWWWACEKYGSSLFVWDEHGPCTDCFHIGLPWKRPVDNQWWCWHTINRKVSWVRLTFEPDTIVSVWRWSAGWAFRQGTKAQPQYAISYLLLIASWQAVLQKEELFSQIATISGLFITSRELVRVRTFHQTAFCFPNPSGIELAVHRRPYTLG